MATLDLCCVVLLCFVGCVGWFCCVVLYYVVLFCFVSLSCVGCVDLFCFVVLSCIVLCCIVLHCLSRAIL